MATRPAPDSRPRSAGAVDRGLSTTVDIETPELIVVSYQVAGVGSRIVAGLIDATIAFSAFIGIIVLFFTVGDRVLGARAASAISADGVALLLLLQFALIWGYYVLFEALSDGQTPGKRAMHL
nr:RDD family protein [Gemmatimonadaceae bacterium]